MQAIGTVSSEKLRGGFYTPPSVVDFCIERLSRLKPIAEVGSLLEPSVGDGAFLRGLERRGNAGHIDVTGVEVIPKEAAKSQRVLVSSGLSGDVVPRSFFEWVGTSDRRQSCDAVVGNPPFVRYQFVSLSDRLQAERTLHERGMELAGVSNLWIPFVLLSLECLRPGGVFALVLPHELLATVSGAQVRKFLIERFDHIRVDLFPRATFPDILQDVLVVSGVRRPSRVDAAEVSFVEHLPTSIEEWSHTVVADGAGWTRFLLDGEQLAALSLAESTPGFVPLGEVARLQVALVTGANAFFTVDSSVIDEYEMQAWARPLLARTEDSPGIVFTENDYRAAESAGKRSWFLDFNSDLPSPMTRAGAARYVLAGEDSSLHERFKCRIRQPWYRVPHARTGRLLMSKRSHQHHRLLLNEAGVLTTDTIYRGEMLPRYRGRERDLVAGFHNSLTLLSAEVEGRTYGGGVLELVPSELARLRVPLFVANGHLDRLDRINRFAGGQKDVSDSIVDATDQVVAARFPRFQELLGILSSARVRLRRRRFGESK